MADLLAPRLDPRAVAWHEAEISRPSLGRWLAQVDTADQPIALRLLECMRVQGWARLMRDWRLLHQRLCGDPAADGFVVERCSDIDSTRAFACKGGDLISVAHRKANRLPTTCFRNIEALRASPPAQGCGGRWRLSTTPSAPAQSSRSPSWRAPLPTAS